MRMNRWAKKCVLDRVFGKLQEEQILQLKIEAFRLDSTSAKVTSGRDRGFEKNGPQAIGKSRGGMEYHNSSGCSECANSHHLLFLARLRSRWPGRPIVAARTRTHASRSSLVMDRAYEGQDPAVGVGVKCVAHRHRFTFEGARVQG